MRSGIGLMGLVAGLAILASVAEARPLRIMALDQCADQYVLAMAPDAELLLTHRADGRDAFYAHLAKGHRQVRPTLENAVSFKPNVVVRYWGGDSRLLRRLEQDGIAVVTIEDARDFEAIRQNILNVGRVLNRPEAADNIIARMDEKLSKSDGAGRAEKVAYLTASGFTAGPDTLIDSILRAAGFRNAVVKTGYIPFGLERALMQPPFKIVRGFFEHAFSDWRGTGRHPVLSRFYKGQVVTELPVSTLTCPAWFAADAVVALAETQQ